ncbi:MAG: helical backbone metal receptor [Burkholderiaceae bacterium]
MLDRFLKSAVGGAMLLALLLPVSAQGLEVKDDRGLTHHFAQPPLRIVSLLPSLTETVCALGQCARLVGVDRYSNYPASVQKLPKLGGGIDPAIEAVLALQPDVVLMASSSRSVQQLRSLGLKVLTLEPKSHADMRRVINTLGELLAIAPEVGAQRVWSAIDSGITAAANALPAKVRQTKVYIEVNNGPYAASEASFLGETLSRLGAVNIVPAALGPFPQLNPEYVVRANPDLIMIGERSDSLAGLAQRPGWSRIRAIQAQRVCVFSPEQSDILVRPGPRMDEAARIMAQCLMEKAF